MTTRRRSQAKTEASQRKSRECLLSLKREEHSPFIGAMAVKTEALHYRSYLAQAWNRLYGLAGPSS